MRDLLTRFFHSKSGLVLSMYLIFSGLVSAGVAYSFYNSSLEKFRAQKAEEKITALRLVDAFVTTYSGLRSQLGSNAPVPATFRAHSIESFNKQAGSSNEFLLRWVGRMGRHIKTPPADYQMARTIEAFAEQTDPKPQSTLSVIDGRLALRTVYPSLAREQSCVNCHNQLQRDRPQWKLNDVMGAFAIDVPIAPFLQGTRTQSYGVGLGLFLALAAVGLAVSILHFRQICEREAAALEVRAQNMRLDAAVKNMTHGLSMFDADKGLVICNDRYAKMYQLPPELLQVGTPFEAIVAHRISHGIIKSEKSHRVADANASAGDIRSEEAASSWIYELASGQMYHVIRQPMVGGGWVSTHEDITAQRHFDELKKAHAAATAAEAEARALAQQLEVINADVTELNVELADNILKLKQAQDENVKKGKLAQLGQLTATVAHEIRNPLGAVKTAAFLVERKATAASLGVEKQFERINKGIARCDKIITELLDFARASTLLLKTTTVDEWVRSTVEEEAQSLPASVQVSLDLGSDGTEATFDTDRMRRVIVNLLTNASEAMVGKAQDKTSVVTESPKIVVSTKRVANRVEIMVADNGPGIPEQNMQKVLEPLFTTKSFGVGLGLPAIEKILELHGGGLRIASTVGEGTAVTAWFPLAQPERKAA